ncbi:MAG: serine/threonine protein kinase [Kofleriaceae bacterium]|nr:serine/threonine protein kinase [Kofleriaceae bacterium]
MGTVYLAEHMLIQRRVAIKVLRAELAADSQVVDRFMNEARAAGAIGHPHIVESTDLGFTREEVPFIVFEYLEGTLLTDEIYRLRGLPPRRALRIATQIASALQAAHTAGIIHRDLKSDNIFLTDKEDVSDHVKVLDFGISRFVETENDDSQGRHQIMGTPEFMSPEQITAPHAVDHRADIYALGVVLYEMLAARRPFDFDAEGRTTDRTFAETDQLLHKIIQDAPPPLGRPDLPPGLEQLINEKLLAKSAEQRFQSMKDVQAALDAFASVSRRDTQPIPATPMPAVAEPVTLPGAPKKRGILWLVAALLAGGAGAALMFKPPSGGAPAQADTTSLAKSALQTTADQLGTALESEAQAARLRAEGIASTPMLRAAIETDAATLKNMIADKDFLIKHDANEVIEILQTKGDQQTSMLRVPETAPTMHIAADGTRVETDGTHVTIVVGTPVLTQSGVQGGVIALATPVDLGAAKKLEPAPKQLALVGLAKPVVLLGDASATGTTVTAPIKASEKSHVSGLSLAAVYEPPAPPPPPTTDPLVYVRYGLFGLAGLMLVLFGVSLARKR